MTKIGSLRHRIALQQVANAIDAGGGNARTWTTTKTVWGFVRPLTGREQLHADQLRDSVTHRITIRYDSGAIPTPLWRVSYDSRTFNIRSVLDVDERNKTLVMMVDENVGT